MIDEYEAHELPERAPHQIQTDKLNGYATLAIDRALGVLPGLGGGVEQGPQLDLLAVETRTPAFARPDVHGHGHVSAGAAAHARDEMAARALQAHHHLLAGVIGVGHEVERFCDTERF